jgi:ATP/maltotriose-dependent transcriptional regulator MalT
LSLLSECRLRLGDAPEALSLARAAAENARRRGVYYYGIVADLCCARCSLRQPSPAIDQAEAMLDDAAARAHAAGAELFAPFILVERAKIARLRGDESTSDECIRQARARLEKIGAGARLVPPSSQR